MNYLLMTRRSYNDLMQNRQKIGKRMSFDRHFMNLMVSVGILEEDGDTVTLIKDRSFGSACTDLAGWKERTR